MIRNVAAMLHVPDVAATADWYEARGFPVRARGSDGGAVIWAALTFGDGEVMLSAGGVASDAFRREADLYVGLGEATAVDLLFARLGGSVEIVEPPHDTFYGAREFIIRDCNRFWITFGAPITKL